MNNPLRILQTFDRHLAQSAEMTLFGRAALALGYPGSPAAFAATHDVDAILPLSWLAVEEQNIDFWQAQQRTNAELEPEGLYLTHLFRELEVILTPDWLTERIRIPLELHRLTVFRDLISAGVGPRYVMQRESVSCFRARLLTLASQFAAGFLAARRCPWPQPRLRAESQQLLSAGYIELKPSDFLVRLGR
jgi:hypothetical protein